MEDLKRRYLRGQRRDHRPGAVFSFFSVYPAKHLPGGPGDRFSLSGLRHDPGGFLRAPSGLCGSLADPSLYLPHHPAGGSVRLEPVYPVQEAPAAVEEMCGCAGGGHDPLLSVEDVFVFPGGAAHELLWGESYRQNPGTSIAFALVG